MTFRKGVECHTMEKDKNGDIHIGNRTMRDQNNEQLIRRIVCYPNECPSSTSNKTNSEHYGQSLAWCAPFPFSSLDIDLPNLGPFLLQLWNGDDQNTVFHLRGNGKAIHLFLLITSSRGKGDGLLKHSHFSLAR
jgi:hypothetical protein